MAPMGAGRYYKVNGPHGGGAEKVGLIFGLILQQEKVELILQPQRTGRNNENNEIFQVIMCTKILQSECPSDNV